ncbi:methyltransferase domain-containing protein [Pendulispora albinea]|uniref:Methyltransferase domain-containing protein n=1 Tax=Pendulispora albinea TaxID=2741071 RepID=A0ABZ2LVH8_9BACT
MWNPQQYERFKAERELPFFDLMSLLRREPSPARVVDLGCGTGELTRVLHRQLGARETLGIDSSAEMLARAPGDPGLRFEQHDIRAFAPAPEGGTFDLVWSNAALQWIDDHPSLFARLTQYVAPGGQLAVQMPANFDYPTHVLAGEVASEAPFRETSLGDYRRKYPLLTPEGYAELLHELGYTKQHVRLQVYAHLLPSRDDVVEWVKGSLLTDYRARLSPELYAQFLERYRARLLPALADTKPFFYPFKRLLIWGAR